MIYVKNKILPPSGYNAVTIFPFVFYKRDLSEIDINHEEIHGKQQKELFLIGFCIAWILEYIFKGYDNISFEKEAYKNESNLKYLYSRKRFAMWR